MDKLLYFTSFGLIHSLINQQEFFSTKSKSEKGFFLLRIEIYHRLNGDWWKISGNINGWGEY